MRNILIGVKRFITNKNTITIFAIIFSLLLLYWAYNRRIENATSPKSVVVAVNEIEPRTLITADLVTIKKIPGKVVKDVYTTTSEVVGKYVSNDVVIPTGGMIYKSMLKEWSELPKSVYGDIPEGNTIVSLSVSMDSTYGNSIFPGNYIDLYFKGEEDGLIFVQKFIESIEVLAVTDSNGKNVFETNGDLSEPSHLIFSVDEDTFKLLWRASYLAGDIFPVPRNSNYSNGTPKPTTIASTAIKNYIERQSVADSIIEGSTKQSDVNEINIINQQSKNEE